MPKDPSNYYDAKFYDDITEGSLRSAKITLQLLFDVYQPTSVIDIGCGQGAWLAAAESLGSKKLSGFDGDWVNTDQLVSNNIVFSPINFESTININGKHDLCISVEVAEHLSEARAKPFINTLCSAADIVLFGAAIKHQGGRNHINEQWQSYWISLFNAQGYSHYDIFRGAIWANDNVAWWYRQNTFLFVKNGSDRIETAKLKAMEKPIPDIVHPRNYEWKMSYIIDMARQLGNGIKNNK